MSAMPTSLSDYSSSHSHSFPQSPQLTDPFPTEDLKWQAVLERNPAADNAFIYIVITTGIYCRPICPARRPSRANAGFASTADEALIQGYRPCKRCLPDQASPAAEVRQKEAIANVKGILLEAALHGRKVGLDELSQRVGMSKFHLLRKFKHAVGISPDAYAKTLKTITVSLREQNQP